MAVSRTSPDGAVSIERVDVDGRSYDLPPSMTEAEFREGLASGDDENPLASLTGCKLSWWEENDEYDSDYPEGGEFAPVFALEWFVPFGSLRELVTSAFTPQAPEHRRGADLFEIEFNELGAIIRGHGSEYRDFNDVQAFLIPGDVKQFNYSASRTESWLAELLEEYKMDPEGFEREARGWDGQVAVTEANGVGYTLVIKVHED